MEEKGPLDKSELRRCIIEGKIVPVMLRIADLEDERNALLLQNNEARWRMEKAQEELKDALRLIEVVRKNDRLEYLCDCTAKDLGGPHLNGCIVKCILGTSQKRVEGGQNDKA